MSAYSEQELRYARPIANALIDNGEFRQWFLGGTKYEQVASDAHPIGEIQRSLRSPTMKNPYWFNYWCGKDRACNCRIGTGIETDILLIFDLSDKKRLGLHVEIKRPGEKLGDGQAESYPRRAACWANPTTRPRPVPLHHEFQTMIVCSRDLMSDVRLRSFDKIILHTEIAKQIDVYPER